MFPDKPKIAVVGSGALGGYYGCLLARGGCDVHFLLRSDYVTVRDQGYRIVTPEETFTLDDVQAYAETDTIGVCDLVIVAVKSTANDALQSLVMPLVDEHTLVLTLQNGLGNAEYLSQFVPATQLLAGLCFVCLNRTAPGVIENTLPGRVFIGEFFGSYRERTMQVVACFERAGIVCYFSKSLDESLWRKLVWNIPFNGLTIAAGGIDTQQLLQSQGGEQLVRLLMQEVQQAALAHGHDIPFAFLDEQIQETLTMGPYKPSSLIDYLAGRDVEVEAIFGEPLRRGKAKGIAMPHMETLYLLLKSLCSGASRATKS